MRDVLAFLPYVLRTAGRARLRSFLTLLGAALAIALFTFVRTVDHAVAALAARSDQPVLVVFQDSRFCPLTSELPLRYADRIREVPGVEAVLPTLVFINSCRSNLDLVTLHGVESQQLLDLYDLQVQDGSVADFQGRSDGALVGSRLAARRRARVGERVRLGEIDVHVSGIVESRTAGVDNLAFVHIDQLALARDKLGGATEFLVKVGDDASPQEIAAAIDDRFLTDEARTDTKTMQAFVAGAVGEIAEVVDFARMLGYLAVAVVALVLGNTVFISVQARSVELGVLETLGLSRPKLAALIACEGTGLGLLGGALGTAVVLGLLWAFPVTLGVEGWGIDLEPAPEVAASALLVAVVTGCCASLVPAIATARQPLAEALQSD